MSSTFDFCLLLYMIRLAGWLKHCYLSLSLSAALPLLLLLLALADHLLLVSLLASALAPL